ncbi:MAG TPA: SUMF1/EgtB/PvdO family nonheme iron enzyme [Myxococcota bacterium]|nr:SUMF1/EgtB/PvdO family nonheme iron enzyme [Myxococcota bacterium]
MHDAPHSESAPWCSAPNPAATTANAGTGPKGVRVERDVLRGFVSASQQVEVLAARIVFFWRGGFQTLLRRGCHFLIEARLLNSSVADGRPASLASDACFGHEHRNSLPDGSGPRPHTASNCFGANCGSVPYTYYISKYDTTNAQYAEFLNAVDPGGSNALTLWNPNMQTDTNDGGISFVSGNASGSKYVVNSGFANDPVVYVNFYDALRFANWLNNGQGSGSTETGAYTLMGGTPSPSNGLTVTRNAGAAIFLPSENEWYKAAYYNPISGSYFAYPAGTSTPTVCAAPGATPNTANCIPGGPIKVTNVGAYTGSASPYGTFDQGGNVFQWNE